MRRPVVLVAMMCVAEILGMLAFATYPTLIPTFQSEWRLTNTEVGWIGGIYFGGYVLAVGALTALTDRTCAKRIYLASMALSALAVAGFALTAQGVATASVWRCLQGVGLAGTYMPGLKALTDALPERLHSRTVAFYTSSFGIGTSVSIYLSGHLNDAIGWQWTFGLSALGPVLAFLVVMAMLPATTSPTVAPATRLLDFRPVLANRRALGFTIAYAAHNAELFGFRNWIVPFIVFSQSLAPAGVVGADLSAATIAAVVMLFALPSSVITNEFAQRFGRVPTLVTVMSASALLATVLGFSPSVSMLLVLVLLGLYGLTITADSSTITAGLVEAAEARYRGTTMAMHSLIGFIGSFLGPIVFGVVLDWGGGETTQLAWGLAFAAMGLTVLIGPIAVTAMCRGPAGRGSPPAG